MHIAVLYFSFIWIWKYGTKLGGRVVIVMIMRKGLKLPSWGMVDSCIYNLISTNNDDNDVQLLIIFDHDHNHQAIIDSQQDQSVP